MPSLPFTVRRAPRQLPARGPFRQAIARAAKRCLGAGALAAALMLAVPLESAADSPASAESAGMPSGTMSEVERDRQAEAIARTIMSPFCPGRTVSSCPNAAPWRTDIRRWVGEGVDAEEIKRRLAARVPQHDLFGVPKNRLGWLLPVGLGVGAVGILVFLLRYLVKPSAEPQTPAPKAESKDGSKEAPQENAADAPAADKTPEEWEARLEQELETLEN